MNDFISIMTFIKSTLVHGSILNHCLWMKRDARTLRFRARLGFFNGSSPGQAHVTGVDGVEIVGAIRHQAALSAVGAEGGGSLLGELRLHAAGADSDDLVREGSARGADSRGAFDPGGQAAVAVVWEVGLGASWARVRLHALLDVTRQAAVAGPRIGGLGADDAGALLELVGDYSAVGVEAGHARGHADALRWAVLYGGVSQRGHHQRECDPELESSHYVYVSPLFACV